MATPPEEKGAPDWERIEADYRAGIKSLREIVAPFNITEGALRKRAKRDGWERDLGAKIQQKADALVRKEAVRNEVRTDEKAIVEANAEAIYRVRMEHRKATGRFQALVQSMAAEIEAQTDSPELFAELSALLNDGSGGKAADKLAEAYRRVLELPGRVDNMKKLVEAFEKLVKLERQAFGLDNPLEVPPEAPESPQATNEMARRVAFLLSKGLRAQKG